MTTSLAASQAITTLPETRRRLREALGPRAGVSLLEVVCVLAIALTGWTVTLAATRQIRAERAGREAARLLMRQLQSVGRQARISGATHAVLLSQTASAPAMLQVLADGNDNGVRAAEVASGVDAPVGAARLAFPEGSARLAIVRDIPNTDHTDTLAAGSAPVRFGIAPFISFSPRGTGPSGSIYMAGPDDRQYAIRVLGTTGRLRLLCLDALLMQWRGC